MAAAKVLSHFPVCCWIDWLLMINNFLIESGPLYRQQKVLSHFPVCCWIDWLLMINNFLIESGPPCRTSDFINEDVWAHRHCPHMFFHDLLGVFAISLGLRRHSVKPLTRGAFQVVIDHYDHGKVSVSKRYKKCAH
jgi:hypothetical protein